jgi:hypothetical protein
MEHVTEERQVGLADYTADHFLPLVGETLVFERPNDGTAPVTEPARMKVLEVKRGPQSPAVRREPFSVLFVMKDQPELGAGLHRLIQAGLEPADLLITRVTVPKYQAIDPAGMYYEVVFG